MIENFEEITQELSEYELSLIPILVPGFENRTENNPVKAPDIINSMKAKGYDISEPRLRKCCNYIRTNSILPLIATSKGYYVSQDPKMIESQIRSLLQRAQSIIRCAEGLKKFLP